MTAYIGRYGRHPVGWMIAVVTLLFMAMAAGPSGDGGLQALTIISGGERHHFRVELAADDDARARGLMYRRGIADDYGMLFDFGRDAAVAMWMRNTLVPLDMLFIDKGGRITHIHENAVPEDDTVIDSKGPVRAVLEVKGGTAARLHLHDGDRIEHPLFPAD